MEVCPTVFFRIHSTHLYIYILISKDTLPYFISITLILRKR